MNPSDGHRRCRCLYHGVITAFSLRSRCVHASVTAIPCCAVLCHAVTQVAGCRSLTPLTEPSSTLTVRLSCLQPVYRPEGARGSPLWRGSHELDQHVWKGLYTG